MFFRLTNNKIIHIPNEVIKAFIICLSLNCSSSEYKPMYANVITNIKDNDNKIIVSLIFITIKIEH